MKSQLQTILGLLAQVTGAAAAVAVAGVLLYGGDLVGKQTDAAIFGLFKTDEGKPWLKCHSRGWDREWQRTSEGVDPEPAIEAECGARPKRVWVWE